MNKKKRQFSPYMEEIVQMPLTEQIKKIQENRSELYQKLEGTIRFDPAVTEENKRIDSELISALAPLSSAFSSLEFFASKVREAMRQDTEEEDDLKKHPTPMPTRRARLTPMKFVRPGVPGSRQGSSAERQTTTESSRTSQEEASSEAKKRKEEALNDSEIKREIAEMERAKREAELQQMNEKRNQKEQKEKDRKKRLIEKKRLMRQEMEARRRRLAERRDKKSDDEGDSYNMSSPEDEMSSMGAKEHWEQKQQKLASDEASLRADTSLERGLDAAAEDPKAKKDSEASMDEDANKNIKEKGANADDLSFVDNEDAIINDEFAEMERLMGVKFVDQDRKARAPKAEFALPDGQSLLENYASVYGNGFMPGWAFDDMGLGFGLRDPTRNGTSTRAGVGFCDYRQDKEHVRERKRDAGLVVGDAYKLLKYNDGFGSEDQMTYDVMNASLNDPFIDVFCQAGNEKAKELYWALHSNSDKEGELPGTFKFIAPKEGAIDLTSKMLMDPSQHDRLERLGMDENDILMQDRSVDISLPGSEAGGMDAIQALDFCTPDIVFRDEPIGKESHNRPMLGGFLCASGKFGDAQASSTLFRGDEFNLGSAVGMRDRESVLDEYFVPDNVKWSCSLVTGDGTNRTAGDIDSEPNDSALGSLRFVDKHDSAKRREGETEDASELTGSLGSRDLDLTPDSLMRLYLLGNDDSPCVGLIGQGQSLPITSCGASVQYIAERFAGEPMALGYSKPLDERYRKREQDGESKPHDAYAALNVVYPREQLALVDKQASEQFEQRLRRRAVLGLATMGNDDCPLIDRDVLLEFQGPLHDSSAAEKEKSRRAEQAWQSTFAVEPNEFALDVCLFKCPEAICPLEQPDKVAGEGAPGAGAAKENAAEDSGRKIRPNGVFADDLLDPTVNGFKCLDGIGTLHNGEGDKLQVAEQEVKPKGKTVTSSDNGYNESSFENEQKSQGPIGHTDSLEDIFKIGANMSLNRPGSQIESPRSPRERVRQTIRVRVKKRVPKKKDVATLVGSPMGDNYDNEKIKAELALRDVEEQPVVRRVEGKTKAAHAESGTQTVLSGEMPRKNTVTVQRPAGGKPEKQDKETLTPPSMRQRANSRKVGYGDFKDLPAIPIPAAAKGAPESARIHKHDESRDAKGRKEDRDKDGMYKLSLEPKDEAKHRKGSPESKESKHRRGSSESSDIRDKDSKRKKGSPESKDDRESRHRRESPDSRDEKGSRRNRDAEDRDSKRRLTPETKEDKDGRYRRSPDSLDERDAKHKRTPDSKEDRDGKYRRTPESKEDKDEKNKRTPESREDKDGKYRRSPDSLEERDAKHKRTPESREDKDGKYRRTPESKEDKDEKNRRTPESKEDRDGKYRRTPESKEDKEARHRRGLEGSENEENESPSRITRKRAMTRKAGLENSKGLPPIPIPPAAKGSPGSARIKKSEGDSQQRKHSPSPEDQEEKKSKQTKETPEKKEHEEGEESSPSVTRKRAATRKAGAKGLPPIPIPPGAKASPGSARVRKEENKTEDSNKSPKQKEVEEKETPENSPSQAKEENESPSPTRTRKRAATRKAGGKELPPIPVPPKDKDSPESARLHKHSDKDKLDNGHIKYVPKLEKPEENEPESPESKPKDEGSETSPSATRKRAASRRVTAGGKRLPPIPVPPTGKGSPGSARVHKADGEKERNSIEERNIELSEDSEGSKASEASPDKQAEENDRPMRATPRKRAASRRVAANNLKDLPPIPVPSPTGKGAPGSARRSKKLTGDGDSPDRDRKPRRVQFIEESVQRQKAPPLALPKVEHGAHEYEELENFVANPWTHLHSSTQEGVPSDEDHLKLMRELSFVTDTQDGQIDIQADAPIDYTIFYSSLAFPITMKHTAIRHIIETMSDMNVTFQDCITQAVNYIPDSLCPLKNSNIIFEQVATRKKKMFQSKEPPIPVRVTFGGQVEIQGTQYDPKKVEIKATKNGFKIGKDQEYEMDPAYVEQLLALSNKPTLDIALSCLADGSDFAAKLIAPNMILALVLLNSPSFTFAMVRNLFQLFTRRERHNFLIRSLILAELSKTPVHLLFKRISIYSKPLLVLFCAFSMTWADDVIAMLVSMKTVEPSKVLKVLIKACLQLPPESFYMIRILLTMLSFSMSDGCQIFSVFFAFLSLVISEVLKLRGQKNSPIPTLMSQILLQLNSDAKSSNRELLYLAPFLVRIFKRVPTLNYGDEDATQISNFVKEHGDKLLPEILKFMDQQKRDQIIAFSFAQNFRFLINMRRQDTSKAITTM